MPMSFFNNKECIIYLYLKRIFEMAAILILLDIFTLEQKAQSGRGNTHVCE